MRHSTWGPAARRLLGGRRHPHAPVRRLRQRVSSLLGDARPGPMAIASTAMTRERWMASLFAVGSLCFLVGPFPGYVALVGPRADAITFFAGSLLFTAGAALQAAIAFPERHADHAAWWSAAVQLAGTLFFNATPLRAMDTALSSPEYDRLVWRPDALGSICFLISGVIAFHASPRRGWRPVRGG